MEIAQMQLSYINDQDRLLFRVRGRQGPQYSLWLTRRLTLNLVHGMNQALRHMVITDPVQPLVNPQAQAAVLAMRREKALQNADFKTPFVEKTPSNDPQDIPMVITRIDLTPLQNQQLRVAFFVNEQGVLSLDMSDFLIHAWIKLIQDGVAHAQWGFSFDVPGSSAQNHLPEDFAEAEKPAYLN